LNADYIARTGKTLGFLNPVLYTAGPSIFTDITVGDNCRTPKCAGQQDGFSCTKGWDPVTGLGSPIYPALKAWVATLGDKYMSRQEQQAAPAAVKASYMDNNRHSRMGVNQ